MFLIKKAVFKPIDCKDSANRTQYQKKSKDFLLTLLLDSSLKSPTANAKLVKVLEETIFRGVKV